MATIDIREEYNEWVNHNVVPLFKLEGISIEDSALTLIAFAMQMQIDDDIVSDKTELFDRAKETIGNQLVDYYKKTFGNKDINFNRAFLMLSDWASAWYPCTPTGEPTESSGDYRGRLNPLATTETD